MADDRKNTMPEEAEERDEQEREAKPAARPAGPVGPNVVFNRGARVALGLTALMLGAACYFIPLDFLKKPLGELAIGGHAVRMSILLAVAVAGAALWAGGRWIAPRLDWLKPGQGRWARVLAYAAAGFMAAFAAVTLHRLPGLRSDWYRELAQVNLAGLELTLRPVFFPSAALAGVMMLGFHLFMNRPRWADFLIETQSEVRRVSWPARREWVGSSIVVVLVVAVVSVFLFLVDEGLSKVLKLLKIGF